VAGARRASLEVFSPWAAGPGRAGFALVPADFEGSGPHRLVLQSRVRTTGLTGSWELELPHAAFSIEFDPRLDVGALLALPDESRAGAIAGALGLVVRRDSDAGPAFYPVGDDLAVLGMPVLEVRTPLPCDLAHAVEVEFGGVAGWFRAGSVTVAGQGEGTESVGVLARPLGALEGFPPGAIDRPGKRPVRARLVPDPDRGWADPAVRSIWPGTVETDWVEVEVVRL
jgi:hypothetical protein